ncbi:VOC family protein [Brevundimonas sp.]|jgi:predicted lactoylglutathione lyase|uniref:VOC family protein n=1 Tax=Brevundimonas sp. TaxID=1871086 RepID=UPI0037BF8CBB
MSQLIFINLPVADLDRSIAFYEAVGAAQNPVFSDETAACMVISDVIHVMLLTHDKWRTFTDRQIPDARVSAQFALCLSQDSRAAVDAVTAKAGAMGVVIDPNPIQDHGFMYCRGYEDPDGHIWEVMWMDPAAVAAGPEAFAANEMTPA